MDRSKFNVMTAYWMDEGSQKDFSEDWLEKVEAKGGTTSLTLIDGTSPYGYYYNPDFLTITSWESKEAFEVFKEEAGTLDSQGLKHINQFILQ